MRIKTTCLVMVTAAVISASTSGAAGVSPASPFYPVWTARECLFFGDGLVAPEVPGRIRWARRCAPEYEGYYRWGEKQGTPDGMRSALYPVYGVLDDASRPVNPRRYYAPVSAPAHEDQCDLPPEYTLVGLCPGLPVK